MENVDRSDFIQEARIHCTHIARCNQRGNRDLTVIDLINANTISIELAAFLMSYIIKGASFIVGAIPGGAGKTTIMCSLLNFIPPFTEIIHTESREIILRNQNRERCCFICHEISQGPYYAYLWGKDLQLFFNLIRYNHILATNLHADTYSQAYHQICIENNVDEEDFYKVDILLFIKVEGGWFNVQRKIATVWVRDIRGHKKIYDGSSIYFPSNFDMQLYENCKRFIENAYTKNIYLMEEFRKEICLAYSNLLKR